jgi:riboflavin biosynthesis pyrimidine reductase
MPASATVTQLFPKRKQVLLESMYLNQDLPGISKQIGRPIVVTAYVTDRKGIVAKTDENHKLQVPPQLKSTSDWRLFNELMAQSDAVISGSSYLKRFKISGKRAEDILFQFEAGQEYENLGQWRVAAGFKQRQPDLIFLTHSLDFEIPAGILGGDRKVFVFTTHTMAESREAGILTDSGAVVIGAGETGVDGKSLMDYLWMNSEYHVVMMATGPSVLALLLQAFCLDFLYVTEVQREIPFKDPSEIRMILPEGRKIGELKDFTMTHRYLQENVTTEDGALVSQEFHRYDRKNISAIV